MALTLKDLESAANELYGSDGITHAIPIMKELSEDFRRDITILLDNLERHDVVKENLTSDQKSYTNGVIDETVWRLLDSLNNLGEDRV